MLGSCFHQAATANPTAWPCSHFYKQDRLHADGARFSSILRLLSPFGVSNPRWGIFGGGVSMRRNVQVLYPLPKLKYFNQINLLSARNLVFQTWQIGQKKKIKSTAITYWTGFNICGFYPMCYGPLENLFFCILQLSYIQWVICITYREIHGFASAIHSRLLGNRLLQITQIATRAEIQECMELF